MSVFKSRRSIVWIAAATFLLVVLSFATKSIVLVGNWEGTVEARVKQILDARAKEAALDDGGEDLEDGDEGLIASANDGYEESGMKVERLAEVEYEEEDSEDANENDDDDNDDDSAQGGGIDAAADESEKDEKVQEVKVQPKRIKEEAAKPKKSGKKSSSFVCGAMPQKYFPKFTAQKKKKGGSRTYPAKAGYVSPMNLAGKTVKARTENGPRKQRTEKPMKRLREGEDALVRCLDNFSACTEASKRAARKLRSISLFLRSPDTMIRKNFTTCAVVGNSGAMRAHKFGEFIDQHEYVARINALPTKKYAENLGNRTDLRVMSYKISKDVCCKRKDYKPDNPRVHFMVWFPASKADIVKHLRKRFKNKASSMPRKFVTLAVKTFKGIRRDLLRLGYGPFEEWEYMTSGMHTVLGLVRSCKVLNIYGFSTDMNNNGPYWFTGRREPPRSGKTQHSWDHERMVYRILRAAGLINVCTP